MRWRIALFAVLGAAVLAGCSSSSSEISSSNVKHLVLLPAELPSGFEPFSEGPTSTLDTQGTTRANLGRFGRQGGWVERLRRSAVDVRGLLIVVSTVDVFGSSKGAQADLEAYGNELARQRADGLAERVVVRGLGDGSVAAQLVVPGGEKGFAIAWVERNATASVTAIGRGNLRLTDVAALARRQQAKLAHAT